MIESNIGRPLVHSRGCLSTSSAQRRNVLLIRPQRRAQIAKMPTLNGYRMGEKKRMRRAQEEAEDS